MANELSIIVKAIDQASGQLEGIGKSVADMSKQFKIAGTMVTGFGVAVAGALGFLGKAALDEELNIKRLATTMANAGTSYDSVKDSLEAVIGATQRKTGVADDEQRDILNRLILVTNDYGKAMELLPTVLDLAAAGEMDAATAATYLGKAYLDLEAGADSVSVRFGQASLQFKSMEDIQNRVAGSAEALVNPFSVLKAAMSDVSEELGKAILPTLKEIINKLADFATAIKDWVAEHPGLVKIGVVFAAIAAALALVIGPMLLLIGFLPAIVSGLALIAPMAGVFLGLLGPIGLVIAAVAALAAIVYLVISNWQSIVGFFRGVWEGIKSGFAALVEFFKANWDKILIGFLPFLALPILVIKNWTAIISFLSNMWNKITDFVGNTIDSVTGFFENFGENVKQIFLRVADFILSPIRLAVNGVIAALNFLIEQYNKLPWGDIQTIKWSFPEFAGGAKVPTADNGGVFRGPGAVKVGNIDEVFMPLNRMGGGNIVNNFNPTINIDGTFLEANESKWRDVVTRIMDGIYQEMQRTSGAS